MHALINRDHSEFLYSVCPGRMETIGVVFGQLACVQALLKGGGAMTEEQMYRVLDVIYQVSDNQVCAHGQHCQLHPFLLFISEIRTCCAAEQVLYHALCTLRGP